MKVVNYFTLEHFVLLAIAVIVVIAIAFFTKKISTKIKKILLISIWAGLVINLVVFMIINISKYNLNIVMYHPVEYIEAYLFGGLCFLPLIFMGNVIFKKNSSFSKMFIFYILFSIGIFSCLLKATTNYGYGQRYMNLSGIQIGILDKNNMVFYFIKTIGYIAFPLLMVKCGYYKPKFTDIPKAMIILIATYIGTHLYNQSMSIIMANLANFGGSLYNVVPYNSNLFYTKMPGLHILEFFYKITGKTSLVYLIWTLPIVLIVFIVYTMPYYNMKDYLRNFKTNFKEYLSNEKKYWKEVFTRPVDYEEILEGKKS